jgi:hypothetical protein
MWRNASEEEKKPFVEKELAVRAEYNEKVKAWREDRDQKVVEERRQRDKKVQDAIENGTGEQLIKESAKMRFRKEEGPSRETTVGPLPHIKASRSYLAYSSENNMATDYTQEDHLSTNSQPYSTSVMQLSANRYPMYAHRNASNGHYLRDTYMPHCPVAAHSPVTRVDYSSGSSYYQHQQPQQTHTNRLSFGEDAYGPYHRQETQMQCYPHVDEAYSSGSSYYQHQQLQQTHTNRLSFDRDHYGPYHPQVTEMQCYHHFDEACRSGIHPDNNWHDSALDHQSQMHDWDSKKSGEQQFSSDQAHGTINSNTFAWHA